MITFKQFFQESAKMPALDNDKPEIYWSRFTGKSLILLRRLDPENRGSDNKTLIHTTCDEMYKDFESNVKHVELLHDWIDLHTNGFTPPLRVWSIADTLNALSHTYNMVKDVPGEWYYTVSKTLTVDTSVIKTYYFEVNKDEYRIGGLKSVISDDTVGDEGSIMNL